MYILIVIIILVLLISSYYAKSHIENYYNYNYLQNIEIIKTVPLNIYQTWGILDLPPKMKENVELLKTQNPEFTYYLYDDKMCRDFIEQHFDKSVVYTYDKLIPGAYKADLFRYCVLYINGGIYLDIKYKCFPGFKLLYLTNKEYFVRDHDVSNGNKGIYQALLICYPYNNILLKCINEIIDNVKNNYWNYTGAGSLSITGPLLMSKYFYQYEIKSFELSFDKNRKYINYKESHILEIYKEYRNEQLMLSNSIYGILYNKLNIYNYINLKSIATVDYTRKIIKNINNQDMTFYSSSPCIISHPINENTYIINIRWVNYTFNEYTHVLISLNSRFELNKKFEKISEEIFSELDYDNNIPINGIEDIRLFNNKNNIYYIGSAYNNNNKLVNISYNNYNYNLNKFQIEKKIITPDFYNLLNFNKIEKNWSLFNYKGDIGVIYNWFPIIIGKINSDNNLLSIINYKYNIPEYFKNSKGTTNGYIKNNEIWFVLHKSQKNTYNKKSYSNYQHFFAVFDLDMNLLRYSELFKLDNSSIEFCIGLIIEIDRIILSYSILDNTTNISAYSIDYIMNDILWYDNKF
jgi:mannosyltransferase OCH1-like enzyme